MNRMYEVDAVAQSDDFMYTGAYWRVSSSYISTKNECWF